MLTTQKLATMIETNLDGIVARDIGVGNRTRTAPANPLN